MFLFLFLGCFTPSNKTVYEKIYFVSIFSDSNTLKTACNSYQIPEEKFKSLVGCDYIYFFYDHNGYLLPAYKNPLICAARIELYVKKMKEKPYDPHDEEILLLKKKCGIKELREKI